MSVSGVNTNRGGSGAGRTGGTRYAYRPGPSLSDATAGTASIRRGHSGQDVRAIQQALNDAGIQPPLEVDGLFGPKTQAAVRDFQRRNGLQVDGIIGPETMQALQSHIRPGSSTGDRGDRFGRRTSGRSGRAPHVDGRPPRRGVSAGNLQQNDEATRNRRRASGNGRTPTPGSSPANDVPAPAQTGPQTYDGRTPARGTTSQRCARNVNPPLTNSEAQGRSANTYSQVVNQFAVGNNPRYARRNGNTYCNIFASDVTRAMGAPIPHWVRRDGTPAEPFERGAHELNANRTNEWLNQHGARHGWRQATAEEAQRHANQGRPAVASRRNPGGIGHIAVVRPGEMTNRGPAIAQAGARNFNDGHVRDVWRRSTPEYWVHD